MNLTQYQQLLAGVRAFEGAKEHFRDVVKAQLGTAELATMFDGDLLATLELSVTAIAKEVQFVRGLLERQYVQEGQNTPIFQGRNLPADVLDSTKRRTFVDHRIQARKPPYDDRENNFPDPLPDAAKE